MPILFFEFLFIWGLALFFSSLCVFIRDIKEAINIAIMIWFYGTPIIYPISLVPDSLQQIFMLNPIAIIVSLIRQALLTHEFNFILFLEIGFFCLLVYFAGAWFFMRSRHAFADVL